MLNGLRYPLVAERGQCSLYRKRPGVESTPLSGMNPTGRVHALLGRIDVLLTNNCYLSWSSVHVPAADATEMISMAYRICTGII
jgi:hypothetical protein